MDLLGEAWRLLEFLRVDVVLSPELASKLSVANTEKGRHGMSWSDVNEAGLKRNIVGSDNADRPVDVIRQAITTFEKKTKLDVHLEPIYLATMAHLGST